MKVDWDIHLNEWGYLVLVIIFTAGFVIGRVTA
jgi:hypothetical protein